MTYSDISAPDAAAAAPFGPVLDVPAPSRHATRSMALAKGPSEATPMARPESRHTGRTDPRGTPAR